MEVHYPSQIEESSSNYNFNRLVMDEKVKSRLCVLEMWKR
ncbi:hypothetical protein SAMN05421578_10158 [Paenibacillus macquariensis]|uniref:Uncharacterized protein n=1 Tax=Paenibacillus macquariensis TaxID=948756 RepID=A0ABY1JJB4_9BACL|nr:hypothetical protein SAMN05421578_10158 [Paenibacillus macquariensis]